MVIVNAGANRIRDLINTDLTIGLAGTGQTAPTAANTGLESEVTDVRATVSAIVSSKSIQVSHVISSVSGTGHTFSEWGNMMNSSATLLSRSVTAQVTHTGTDEISKLTTYSILND